MGSSEGDLTLEGCMGDLEESMGSRREYMGVPDWEAFLGGCKGVPA